MLIRAVVIHSWWWPDMITTQYVCIIGKSEYMCTRASVHSNSNSFHVVQRDSTVQYNTQTHVGLLTFRLEQWHVTMKLRYMLLFIWHTQNKEKKTKLKLRFDINEWREKYGNQSVLWYLIVDPERKLQYMQSWTIITNMSITRGGRWYLLFVCLFSIFFHLFTQF